MKVLPVAILRLCVLTLSLHCTTADALSRFSSQSSLHTCSHEPLAPSLLPARAALLSSFFRWAGLVTLSAVRSLRGNL
eukprot:3852721-Rhodomonas_salina.2